MDNLLVNICDATPCGVVDIATFVDSNTLRTITDPFLRYYHSNTPRLTEGTPKYYYYGPDGETYCAYDSEPHQRNVGQDEQEEYGYYDANTIIQDHQTLLYEEEDDDDEDEVSHNNYNDYHTTIHPSILMLDGVVAASGKRSNTDQDSESPSTDPDPYTNYASNRTTKTVIIRHRIPNSTATNRAAPDTTNVEQFEDTTQDTCSYNTMESFNEKTEVVEEDGGAMRANHNIRDRMKSMSMHRTRSLPIPNVDDDDSNNGDDDDEHSIIWYSIPPTRTVPLHYDTQEDGDDDGSTHRQQPPPNHTGRMPPSSYTLGRTRTVSFSIHDDDHFDVENLEDAKGDVRHEEQQHTTTTSCFYDADMEDVNDDYTYYKTEQHTTAMTTTTTTRNNTVSFDVDDKYDVHSEIDQYHPTSSKTTTHEYSIDDRSIPDTARRTSSSALFDDNGNDDDTGTDDRHAAAAADDDDVDYCDDNEDALNIVNSMLLLTTMDLRDGELLSKSSSSGDDSSRNDTNNVESTGINTEDNCFKQQQQPNRSTGRKYHYYSNGGCGGTQLCDRNRYTSNKNDYHESTNKILEKRDTTTNTERIDTAIVEGGSMTINNNSFSSTPMNNTYIGVPHPDHHDTEHFDSLQPTLFIINHRIMGCKNQGRSDVAGERSLIHEENKDERNSIEHIFQKESKDEDEYLQLVVTTKDDGRHDIRPRLVNASSSLTSSSSNETDDTTLTVIRQDQCDLLKPNYHDDLHPLSFTLLGTNSEEDEKKFQKTRFWNKKKTKHPLSMKNHPSNNTKQRSSIRRRSNLISLLFANKMSNQ